MAANSEIILSSNTHVGDSTVQTVTGTNFKGDGYYGRSDGFHSIQYTYDGLTGTITIQGTLAVTPVETDWFDVHAYTAAQETASKIASFTGNYVWVRAKVAYTDGTVSSIVLNH
jgi:hypothetical protein|tara:strand:- start:18 stop:359 length:342 start_codon:yes stop_codon:yes gene_type:complete